MRRVLLAFARTPRWLAAAALVVVPAVLLVATDSSRWAVAFSLGVLGLAIATLAVNLAGIDPDAEDRARLVSDDPTSVALLARWLRRSRHFRYVGGCAGTVLGLIFVQTNWLPVLIGLLAGIAAGGAAAEIHSLGRGRRGRARTAELSRRRLRDYANRVDLVALAAVAVSATVLIAVAASSVDDDRRAALNAAVAALVVVAAVATMQGLVVVRPRPALRADLRRADDLMRRLAATQGFTRPGIALGIVLVVQALVAIGLGDRAPWVIVGLILAAGGWYLASRQSRRTLVGLGRS